MKTSLYEEHINLGAKMTEFGGWEMPLYYSGITDEALAVRNTAGIFDLSHMGEFYVSGPQALDFLQTMVTNDVSCIEVGHAQYTLLCDEGGGVIDDLIIYRLEPELYMPVVNASNTITDFKWFLRHSVPSQDDKRICAYGNLEISNESTKIGLITVQGPASKEILQPLLSFDLGPMKRFCIQMARIDAMDVHVASTGYTGAPGYELYCAWEECAPLWRLLLQNGKRFDAKPAGLGARDVLRIEAGYPLYGHELTRTTTPLDAKLMWTVNLDKDDFIGKQAIIAAVDAGADVCLAGLRANERCVPRAGYDVTIKGEIIGHVTSGTFSPTLQKGIAMAYIRTPYAAHDNEVSIDIRGKSCPARIVKMPFLH